MGPGTSADQRIERMTKGREAGLAAGIVKPFIDKKIEETLTLLVARFREGDIHHDEMLGGIAAISTLWGLMSDLERVHKQGIKAAEVEYATSRHPES